MRQTYCVPAAYSHSSLYQPQLEAMWKLIEDHYEEDWRVDLNGDVLLVVDSDFLHRILEDCASYSQEVWNDFEKTTGVREEHNPEAQRWEWVNVPEHLQGTYYIRGIYRPEDMRLMAAALQKREYFFVQEGY